MKKKLTSLLAFILACSMAILPTSALELADAKALLEEHYMDGVPADILALDSLEAILDALNDPYTVYYTAEEYQSFLTSVNGDSVLGIGVSLQTVFDRGFLILSTLPHSPALEAGLQAGDRIVAVDGIELTATSDIRSAIGGEEGTTVTVTVIRQENGLRKDFTMERRAVPIPIVTFEMLGNAGYIDCSSFGSSTSEVVNEALSTLNDKVSTWIMDLRSNPGGTANASAAAAGWFAGNAIMMYMRNSADEVTYYYTPGFDDLTDKPLIVLTSSYSASGAESFAADARDHRFGIGLGQRTFGKGVAQTAYDKDNAEGMFDGDALKITTHRFFSPKGTTNHIVGVIPTLLVSKENTLPIAQLLSAPAPSMARGYLKLTLEGHTFYLDQQDVKREENRAAFTELLEALPLSAKLFTGAGISTWTEVTPAQLAAQLGLDYTPRTFTDISDSAFAEEIETLARYFLLSGYGDGTFRPQQFITRAEFCTMLSTALNLPLSDSARAFSDMAGNEWHLPYISSMLDRGFIAGYEDNTFHPDATITYQEMVTILSAVGAWANMDIYECNKEDLSIGDWGTYIDWATWAQIPARNLAEAGVDIDPTLYAQLGTRQQAAGMLCQLMESIHLLWN